MIIDIRPGLEGKAGFAKYAINRDEESFVIIEGEPNRIERLAQEILQKSKFSHYSYVLSFKEEELTIDQMYDYYMQFKNMMFDNYNPDELAIFSVIHLDDNKPHIHCNVLTKSQITGRDLRQWRGNVDFPRREAITEIINYENNLESLYDNQTLVQLTPEQKKRDWLVKKGNQPYRVFDDSFYNELNQIAKKTNSYENMLKQIELKYGKIEIKTKKIDNKNVKFLVLSNHHNKTGTLYTYESDLFNKTWFNKNIQRFKNSKLHIRDYKYSKKKKTLEQYKNMLGETSKKHLKHITQRGVGKIVSKQQREQIFQEELDKVAKLSSNKENSKELKKSLNKLFDIFKNEDEFDSILKAANTKKLSIGDNGLIEHKLFNGSIFTFDNTKLYEYLEQFSNQEYYIKDPSGKFEDIINQLIMLDISSHKNKQIFREKFDSLFWKNKISSIEELAKLLDLVGYKIDRAGDDKTKGKYITISSNANSSKKISLYNSIYHNFYTNNIDQTKINDIKNQQISQLETKFLNSYVDIVAARLYKTGEFIETCQDYKLKSSPLLDYSINLSNSNKYIYTNKNKTDEIIDSKNNLTLKKSTNIRKSATIMADILYKKQSKKIVLDKADDKFTKAFINRIKANNYNIQVLNKNNEVIYTPPLQSQENVQNISKEIAKTTISEINENLNSSQINAKEILVNLYSLDMNKRNDFNEFKNIIEQLSNAGIKKDIFIALFEACDIEIVKSGKDTKKGDYITLKHKDKNAAIYSKTFYDVLNKEESPNNEIKKVQLNTSEYKQHIKNNEELAKEIYEKGTIAVEYNENIVDILSNQEENPPQQHIKYRQKNIEMVDKGNKITVNKLNDIENAVTKITELLELKRKNGKFKEIYVDNDELRYELSKQIIKKDLKINIYGPVEKVSQSLEPKGMS